MKLPTELDKLVTDAIKSRFDLEGISEIRVSSIEVDEEEQKIRIELLITTTESPEVLAARYFGLTGKVREALGSDWSGFFPVITPQFSSVSHA